MKVKYLIAADMSKDTLIRLTRKVSQMLGTGKVKIVDQEDAMLNRDITVNFLRLPSLLLSPRVSVQQADYDMLLVSLQFEPAFIREQMNIRWHCENGMIENMQKVIDEYRTQRNLTVIRRRLLVSCIGLNRFLGN